MKEEGNMGKEKRKYIQGIKKKGDDSRTEGWWQIQSKKIKKKWRMKNEGFLENMKPVKQPRMFQDYNNR